MEDTERLGSGAMPNDVLYAASGFLEAAELMFSAQDVKDSFSQLHLQKWHVVHHLSVIATELYMKSLIAEYAPETECDFVYLRTEKGHSSHFDLLDKEDQELLRETLEPDQITLLSRLGISDISSGRYPYEYTSGFINRALAEKWICLARALDDIRKRQVGGMSY